MKAIKILKDIKDVISKTDIKYRIINTNDGKNLILLSEIDDNLKEELKEYDKYIQEIIIENDKEEDEDFIERIKELCNENEVIHRNTSYTSWNRKSEYENIKNIDNIENVISGS
jgi:hypothetical protein